MFKNEQILAVAQGFAAPMVFTYSDVFTTTQGMRSTVSRSYREVQG
jgi:hypothetical protein